MLDKILELEEEPYSQEDAEWDAFVAGHPNGSLLQTTAWARLKNRFGWRSHRVWLRRDGRLVAGAQVLIRSAALGLLRLAYIPHGPLVNWQDDEQVSVLLNQVDFAAYERRAGLLKMEPLLWQSDVPPAAWEALCRRQGCLPNSDTIQPPNTIIIDLQPPEEDILAAMKQKTRYNIRLAEKKGVTVRQGTAGDLPIFNALMQLTGRRNEFGVHDPAYYRAAYELFAPDHAALFIAEYNTRPLAAIMLFVTGPRAVYLAGGSSNEERQRMPTYAVQWAAIRWARARGCAEYDLWGVPDYPENELESQFEERDDGLWGVYRFKRGFGGQVRRTVGAADRVYNNLVYRLYHWRRGR
ncbi:MAG: peptidoglycan bridge formation glycyltransferase FemA/FemB family protein [Chloroflexi bacterium]|nr:peptidoglycan bridge formation glycyltransferase FemA/FemB family protein [Chloroflexota bacterium]MCI0579047.1 peptidoglycan bridge formation glycyltransferase FemA/FemB family protein [Chloroflexota bacterium]MCI0644932.1 peptidoglycan bridge formation glycyltransferase FemA/FemB family protein [Chloroflexota bacterium]MCI0731163.1 peptidoglycan bridge formation glycyltransferase FemA/FemB family protein [Chloroflexota bacterium]